jgi:glycosyltransferase involved in cell wall biosynthesis
VRLIWWSNAPGVSSGYGNQTALFAPRINAIGHPTALFAFAGLQNGTIIWEGLRVYPKTLDRYGNDSLSSHATHWKADVVISLFDAIMAQPHTFRGVPWCPWFPIDSHKIRVKELAIVKQAYQPLVFSRFGEEVARQAGLDPRYVPHGIDTAVFRPGDKLAVQEQLHLPADRFVVGMVAANQGKPSRKAFPEQFQAFAEFKRRHSDAFLYVHSWLGSEMSGPNLVALLSNCPFPSIKFLGHIYIESLE